MQVLPGGQPAWNLWGVSETPDIDATQSFATNTQQLVSISYHRPESWRFMFAARILGGPTIAGQNVNAVVHFDVNFGVGRGQVTYEAFRSFNWVIPATTPPTAQPLRWSNSGVPQSGVVTDPNVEAIPAQSINVTARILMGGAVGPLPANTPRYRVMVAAFFSPWTHVRPDWFADVDDELAFRSGELGGM